MSNILTTTQPPNSVASTADPQSVTQSSSINGGTRSTIQNSVNSNNLNTTSNSTGIPLTNQGGQPIAITATTAQSVATGKDTTSSTHHLNPLAITLVVILVVAAVSIFIGMSRSSKNTTQY